MTETIKTIAADKVELIAYEVGPNPGYALEVAPKARPWMDAFPGRFAYRCLPMVMANQSGWIIRCPLNFSAKWNGKLGSEDSPVWRITLKAPSFIPVLEHADDTALRRDVWQGSTTIGNGGQYDNTKLIWQILDLRHLRLVREGLYVGLLHHLLGFRVVLQDAAGQAKEALVVLSHDRLEGRGDRARRLALAAVLSGGR